MFNHVQYYSGTRVKNELKPVNYHHQNTLWVLQANIRGETLTMYYEHSEAGAPPRHEDQRIFIAVVSEVGKDRIVPDEMEVSQCLVVLLSDELQRRVRHQHVVTVQVESLQGQAGL